MREETGTRRTSGWWALALACALPAGAAEPAARVAALGVNLEGVADWQAQPLFADAIRQGRGWSAPGNLGARAPVDGRGWPAGDAAILVGSPPARMARPEPYRLTFRGRATVSATSASVANVSFDPSTGITSADVTVARSDNFILSFSGDPGGVKDVRLLRPGHGPQDVFDRTLLARLAHFSTIRFMQALGPPGEGVPGNPSVEWADRTLPSDPIQSGPGGIAWEYVILLANLTGKDAWITIPAGASDAYVTQLARLFRYGSDGVSPYAAPQAAPRFPPLDPARTLYVEVGNELWNTGYKATHELHRRTVAELAAGDPHRLGWRPGNAWECTWRRVGYMGVRASMLFRAVFGDAEMMTRVRPVLAMQLVRAATFTEPLDYVRAVWGKGNPYGNPGRPVSGWFYAIAAAPYLNVRERDVGRDDLSVTDVFASVRAQASERVGPAISWAAATAKANGLALLAYEGGQHLLPAQGSAAAKLAAQTHPAMKEVLVDLVRGWSHAGGELFVYYTLCSTWGRYGYFGLSEDIASEAGPKWEAVKQMAAERSGAVPARAPAGG